ncbi:hypothetical protein Zmor_006360 [Zophobas morio]|uniref:Gustatory receptor n=1 Tax=Zophobas morio TaxID=2755281 RepID=A0AA38ITM6_9CUCU|nr:hypothetical protein Zmor_006360 [Zophobas morio]
MNETEQRLINLFSWLFFVCKWTGFTSYSLVNDPGDKNQDRKIFKRTGVSIFINIVIITLLVLLIDVRTCVGTSDSVNNVSTLIALTIDALYFVVLVLIMNFKQTRVVSIFYRLVAFGELVEEITRRKIDESKVQRFLRIYVFVVYSSLVVMLATNWWQAININPFLLFWLLKDTFLRFVSFSGEILIFYYMFIAITIARKFNGFLKEADVVERKQIKQIFQTYCDLKHDIQNITQVIIFFKIVWLIIELAITFYQIIILGQSSDEEPYLDSPITLVYWIFELSLEVCLLLCPFIVYYRETSMTFFLYDDIQNDSLGLDYKEREIFYLQTQVKRLKFTTHGLLELDWPLFYTVAALVCTYLVYLVQFQQLSRV